MMNNQAIKMAVELESSTTTTTKQSSRKRRNPSKQAVILRHLLSGKSINRFEAEKIHDHCLNTTISILVNSHNLVIERVRETVPCLNGTSQVSVARYWLSPVEDNIRDAELLLERLLRHKHDLQGGGYGA